jgi:hypothetical protein
MVIESRACPSCSESIPPGRLSCPHCGAVLAAVARVGAVGVTTEPPAPAKRPARAKRPSRAAARKAVVKDDGWDVVLDEAVPPHPIEPASEPAVHVPATELRSGWPPAAAAEVPPPPALGAPQWPAPAAAVAMPPPPAPGAPQWPAPVAAREAAVMDDGWDADSDDTGQPAAFQPVSSVIASSVPVAVSRSPWPAAVAPEPPPSPAPELPPAPAPESPPPALGAYVPPAVEPEAPPAQLTAEPPPASILPRAYDPVAAASGEGVVAAAPSAPGRMGRIAMPRIDRERVESTADTIMLVGSFGLVLSFLAPWADAVIGSRGRGYMDTWGLAGPGHIALFLLALGVLALAVLENPIGRWLRTGVAGVALGGFVLGLAWPYVVGPLGAGPGALLAWVSGLVLFVAGIVSLLVLRHAALPPDV